MTVATYTPGRVTIHLTDAARRQLHREIERADAATLRLNLDESGCSGYMYVLEFVESAPEGDERLELGDISLYVPQKYLAVLDGLEIDYVREGVNSLFKFRNPNATAECGCGESFTVEDIDEV